MDNTVTNALTNATGDLGVAVLGVLVTTFLAGTTIAISVIGLMKGWAWFKRFAGVGGRRR